MYYNSCKCNNTFAVLLYNDTNIITQDLYR